MKLVIFIGFLFISAFHQVGIGEDGTLLVKVIKSNDRNLLNISGSNTDCVDSLIIHTDKWRIALGRSDFSDESIFEINSAETAVLKMDLIQSFELRFEGKIQHYQSTDSEFLRRELAK